MFWVAYFISSASITLCIYNISTKCTSSLSIHYLFTIISNFILENIKLHFGKSVFLLAKLHWFFINSRRLCTWTKTFSKWNRVFVKRLLDFWFPVYLVHLKNLHIWLKFAKCSVSNTLTKSKWMRRCFEPHISPPVVLYFCVFTIFQQNVFKHFIYYDIKWT